MIRVEPFRAQHFDNLCLQGAQAYMGDWLTPENGAALERSQAFSALVGDTVIGCAGVVPVWAGRAVAWSLLAWNVGPHFVHVHRAVARFLDQCEFRRVEISVDCEFAEGHRWARLLGFEMEAERMRGYRPDGGDCALYARVR